jgi:membrane protein DedA with SNARE-associated domain
MEDVLQNPGNYLSIIVILILTGCGLPLPEEIPIIGAGVAASLHNLDPWAAVFSCLIGALLGDSVLYAIGYHFGRNLVEAHPRLAHLLHAEREAKMEQLIDKHGLKVLLAARFMVGVRAPVYLTIGILRQPFRKFILFDAFCASAVVSVFFGLSYAFGENVAKWVRESELVFTALVIGAVLVGLIIFWVRRRRRRSRTETPRSDGKDGGDGKEMAPADIGNQDAASLAASSKSATGGGKHGA